MEIISPAENKIKNFNDIPKTQEEVGWFWGKAVVYILLVSALIIDIAGAIFAIIDLASIGIIGWILRIVFFIFYVFYFILFWIESNKFDYTQGVIKLKKNVEEQIIKFKNDTKRLIIFLRSILGTTFLSKLLPIIGAIFDLLPIETLSVIWLFYIWPRVIKQRASKNDF